MNTFEIVIEKLNKQKLGVFNATNEAQLVSEIVNRAGTILGNLGYAFPNLENAQHTDAGKLAELVSIKEQVAVNLASTLKAYQKSFTPTNQVKQRITAILADKNLKEETKQNKIKPLLKEVERLEAVTAELFIEFYKQKVAEETVRMLPQAYETQTPYDWFWAGLHLLRISPSYRRTLGYY